MIDFQKLSLSQREQYNKILFSCPPRGCEYSFANLSLWGLQKVSFLHGCVAFFSHFYGLPYLLQSVKLFDLTSTLQLIHLNELF